MAWPAPLAEAVPLPAAGVPPPHPSITISSEADFASPLSGVRSGDGSAENPYRISNWTIAVSRAHAVRLANTASHVVLEDLLVFAWPTNAFHLAECQRLGCDQAGAIEVVHASNVTIQRVRLLDPNIGVALIDAADVTLRDTEIGWSGSVPDPYDVLDGAYSLEGVRSWGSDRVQLRNVTIDRSVYPLRLEDGRSFLVEDSRVEGVWGYFSYWHRMEDVTFRNTEVEGAAFYLEQGDFRGLRIEGSTFREAPFAIYASSDAPIENVHICGSRFLDHSRGLPAVSLDRGSNATLIGNEFARNEQGFSILVGGSVRFEGNHVHASSYSGGWIVGTGGTIRGNSFENNGRGTLITGAGADATGNWWGDASGPSGIGPGSGDRLRTSSVNPVAYQPWLNEPPALSLRC